MLDQAIAARDDTTTRYLQNVLRDLRDDKKKVTGINDEMRKQLQEAQWAQEDSRKEAARLRMEAQMNKDKEMIDHKRKLAADQRAVAA